ncbi:MAG: hypothetical protein MZV65_22370 [Chromatiales bacterium]|nr:hypothetical protein [Chromatiales bacterium]
MRAAEAAVGQQRPNGWFSNNCLTRPLTPLTHTIGYTLQGLLEVGVLAQREDIIAAARSGADAVLAKIQPNGYLAARFDDVWRPAAKSSCLTGNAQIAIVAYRLFEITGQDSYRESADRLMNYLKARQRLSSDDQGIQGAIGGSFPITGDYMTWGYPNWATKYFADSLMLQSRLSKGRD